MQPVGHQLYFAFDMSDPLNQMAYRKMEASLARSEAAVTETGGPGEPRLFQAFLDGKLPIHRDVRSVLPPSPVSDAIELRHFLNQALPNGKTHPVHVSLASADPAVSEWLRSDRKTPADFLAVRAPADRSIEIPGLLRSETGLVGHHVQIRHDGEPLSVVLVDTRDGTYRDGMDKVRVFNAANPQPDFASVG